MNHIIRGIGFGSLAALIPALEYVTFRDIPYSLIWWVWGLGFILGFMHSFCEPQE